MQHVAESLTINRQHIRLPHFLTYQENIKQEIWWRYNSMMCLCERDELCKIGTIGSRACMHLSAGGVAYVLRARLCCMCRSSGWSSAWQLRHATVLPAARAMLRFYELRCSPICHRMAGTCNWFRHSQSACFTLYMSMSAAAGESHSNVGHSINAAMSPRALHISPVACISSMRAC